MSSDITSIFFFFFFYLAVLDRSDFLPSGSSSAWSHSEFTPDEDSSGLDYMLALSLQSDSESMAGGVEGNLWSGIWDHKIEKTPNTSVNTPLTPPNNNYPNFTTGIGTSAVEDHGQTGKWYDNNTITLQMMCLSGY